MAGVADLALMDLNMVEMYREGTRVVPAGWIVEADGLCCCGTPQGTITTNMAIVTGEPDVTAVAEATLHAFGERGVPFSLWTRAHRDAALETALRAGGWLEVANVPAMTFHDGDGSPVASPADVEIRPVVDDAGRAAYAAVMAAAYALYGNPETSVLALFATLPSLHSATTQAFLAWRDGIAVAGATLYLTHGVGGVGWVGTLPAWFGRGYGAAVTWAVVAEGFQRGAAFMNLQASPMGAPVYRRMGFREPTSYRMFVAPF